MLDNYLTKINNGQILGKTYKYTAYVPGGGGEQFKDGWWVLVEDKKIWLI